MCSSFRTLCKRRMWTVSVTFGYAVKRLMDIAGATLGLIVLLPLFAAVPLAVWLDDRSPVLFSQMRVGRGGRPFRMLKFRSMHNGAEHSRTTLPSDRKGPAFKMKDDPRVTRVGRIIRKLSLDELPQLVNVLRGEMSLVGPRPALPEEVRRYTPEQLHRLRVKPGMTCLWQIKGRGELCFDRQVALDVEYIESRSLGKDILILLKTVPAVISGRGAY